MNRVINILTATLIGLAINCPVFAQWDLGGMSAGQGQNNLGVTGQGNRLTDAAGQPMQPYREQNAIQPNQSQAIYNYSQRGMLMNPNSGLRNGFAGSPLQPYLGGNGALPSTYMPAMSPMKGLLLPAKLPGVYGGLPPTRLDSFVRNAGGAASRIYGDEGTNWIPPQNGFPESSTINAGIVGTNNKTLTTGHGSKMPSASGNGNTKSGAR